MSTARNFADRIISIAQASEGRPPSQYAFSFHSWAVHIMQCGALANYV